MNQQKHPTPNPDFTNTVTLILGIETSCDETAAAVVQDGRHVLSNIVASQHDLHEKYRGVVPEIASRAHLERINPTIEQALEQSKTTFDQIDAIAVGNRPGLIGSLLVGVSAAQSLAWSLSKPLIGVDHVEAHLYAASLVTRHTDDTPPSRPQYPALGLVVSGGHSSLYRIESPTELYLLGRTIDDAVGEAYDKAAVILELGYPGGPNVDRAANRGQPTTPLPRSLLNKDSLDFSFSGLKTALLYKVRGKPIQRDGKANFERDASSLTHQQRNNLAASFQDAATGALISKVERAIHQMDHAGCRPQSLIIGGGVCANSLLRERVKQLPQKHHDIQVFLPPLPLCLDNAAMIAGLAYEHLRHHRTDELSLPAMATTSGIAKTSCTGKFAHRKALS